MAWKSQTSKRQASSPPRSSARAVLALAAMLPRVPLIFARGLRVALAVALAVVLSGVPRAWASAVLGSEPPCADCPDDDDGDEEGAGVCPPLCSTGACAKVFPTVPSALFSEGERALAPTLRGGAQDVGEAAPDGVGALVFHPPRC